MGFLGGSTVGSSLFQRLAAYSLDVHYRVQRVTWLMDPPLNLYGDVAGYHFVVKGCYKMMARYGHYKMVGSKDDISIT